MIKWIHDWKLRQNLQKDGWLVVFSWTDLSFTDEYIYQELCRPRLYWLDDNDVEYVILGSDIHKLWVCQEDAMAFKLVWGYDE